MEKTKESIEMSPIVIEGYKVTVKVTEKALSLTDLLDDLLGKQLEKI